MLGYLKRLATTGAAYQAADVVSRVFGLVTIPLYTRHVTEGEYGAAEVVVASVVLLSIPLRLGLAEALVRFWFTDEDAERRRRLARTTTATVFWITTVAALAGLLIAGEISEALLGFRDAPLIGWGLLGVWGFANLEVARALLRAEERRRAFLLSALANVVLTVALTVLLVVVLDHGARGLVAGNFVATAVTVLGLWVLVRDQLGIVPSRERLRPLLRFGLPTVPADASVFALNVVDRAYLVQAESPRSAGLYAVAVKLSSIVIVAVRGFQYAWPPLAYSVRDDDEARRLYGLVVTWYLVLTGVVVAAVTLLARWLVRLFAAPEFADAHEAVPWVGLGWALSGLVLVFAVVAGRMHVTARNVPAAVAGLAVNVVLLVVLVPPLGIAGAGVALCGAYAVMLAVLAALTRGRFSIAFEWGRLARLVIVLVPTTVAGELLLPTEGAVGLATRAALAAILPALLYLSGFLSPDERAFLARRASAVTPGEPPAAAR
jgi:O-antigen/teichoic acid export membrane protein